MIKPEQKGLGLLVCMPTRGAVSVETMLCLREHMDGYPNKLLTVFRKPLVQARNQLAKECRELDHNSLDFDPRYVLWVDDDAWWAPGIVDRAVAILETNPEVQAVGSIASAREAYASPFLVLPGGGEYHSMRYKDGELTPLHVAGAHFLLHRRRMLDRLEPEPFNRIQQPARILEEDTSFCFRIVREFGFGSLVTEKNLNVGHVEVKTGLIYFANGPALKANGANAPTCNGQTPAKNSKAYSRSYFSEDGGDEVWQVNVA